MWKTKKKFPIANQAKIMLIVWYVNSSRNINFRRKLWSLRNNLVEMCQSVYSGEERTVQPSTSLQNNSAIVSGTSVSPVADLTYCKIQWQFRFETNSKQRIRSSARYMLAVKIPALAPCIFSPAKYFSRGPFPSLSFCRATYRYAEKAPGKTVMKPKADSSGLSKNVTHLILEILRCDQRIEQIFSSRSQHSLDLSTSSCRTWALNRRPSTSGKLSPFLAWYQHQ